MENSHSNAPRPSPGGLKLKIIGNGGAVNNRLPHNSALLNDHFLVDCPPDIVHSLQTVGIQSSQIDRMYISHFHGDHTFGFPFFVLDKWIGSHGSENPSGLAVYGPENVQDYLFKLTEMAWSQHHPCYHWLKSSSKFHEVREGTELDYDEYKMSIFSMEHIPNTFGFSLTDGAGITRFCYMTDTRWCPQIARELHRKPGTVLIDINGGGSGLHLSYEELVEHAIPITEQQTRYLGTHIGQPRTSSHERIQVVSQGEEYDL